MCGCNTVNARYVTDGISLSATLGTSSEQYKFSVVAENGKITVTTVEPKSLEGFGCVLNDGKTEYFLGDIRHKVKDNDNNSVMGIICNALHQLEELTPNSQGDKIKLDGSVNDQPFTCYITEVGIPYLLELPKLDTSVQFTNASILN